MAYTRNLAYKSMSNTRISSRYKQWIALIAAIIIGMIISASVNAIPSKVHRTAETQAIQTEQPIRH